MNRSQIERIYEANGRTNYRLETLKDLELIHGISYKVKGYNNVSEDEKRAYETFLINYMNGLGLSNRMNFVPTGIHRVEQICYSRFEKDEDDIEEDGYYVEFARDVIDLVTGDYLKKYRHEELRIEDAERVTKEEILRVDYLDQGMDEDSPFYEQWLHIIEEGTQWY